jgi:hypothetical protein
MAIETIPAPFGEIASAKNRPAMTGISLNGYPRQKI